MVYYQYFKLRLENDIFVRRCVVVDFVSGG